MFVSNKHFWPSPLFTQLIEWGQDGSWQSMTLSNHWALSQSSVILSLILSLTFSLLPFLILILWHSIPWSLFCCIRSTIISTVTLISSHTPCVHFLSYYLRSFPSHMTNFHIFCMNFLSCSLPSIPSHPLPHYDLDAGKIKYLGLSECTPAEIKRAHAVAPLSAIQMEYSLQSRFSHLTSPYIWISSILSPSMSISMSA